MQLPQLCLHCVPVNSCGEQAKSVVRVPSAREILQGPGSVSIVSLMHEHIITSTPLLQIIDYFIFFSRYIVFLLYISKYNVLNPSQIIRRLTFLNTKFNYSSYSQTYVEFYFFFVMAWFINKSLQ